MTTSPASGSRPVSDHTLAIAAPLRYRRADCAQGPKHGARPAQAGPVRWGRLSDRYASSLI
jgi:hypothetical protein